MIYYNGFRFVLWGLFAFIVKKSKEFLSNHALTCKRSKRRIFRRLLSPNTCENDYEATVAMEALLLNVTKSNEIESNWKKKVYT